MKIKTNTLFSKLIIRFILITIISITLLGILMLYNFNNYLFQQKEEEIIAYSQRLSAFILRALEERNLAIVRNMLEILARINNGQVWLINSQGILTLAYPADNNKIPVRYFRYREVLSGEVVSQRINLEYFEEPMLLIGLPLDNASDIIEFGLLIFTPVSGIRKIVNQVIRLVAFSSLLAVLMSILVAYNWSRALSNPLKDISSFALILSSGNFGQTINIEEKGGIKELQDLAKSINQMSLTLQKTITDLTEEKNKLKYVLTGMEEGVLAINQEQKIILINFSASSLFDSQENELTGKKLSEAINDKQIIEMFKKVLSSQLIYSEELSLENEGIITRLLVHLTPIKIDDKLWAVVALFQDITERWRFEQLQREFVTNVSHDLKTPLSSIKGAAEVLLDEIVDTPQKEKKYLKMIYEESIRLEKLVREILTLEGIHNGSRQLWQKEKIDVKKLLENVTMIFNSIIDHQQKVITIVKEFPAENIYVRANRERLKQVLLNLLDNAYKFSSDQGIVKIGCSTEGSRVKFWVQDKGIGIPAGELENIWERFYKIDKVRSSAGKGSGLGLSIVKQLVETQGGSVFVESKLQLGSVFGFYLDIAKK
ncbi:ATP-binding protein [Halocella sp. SP3-1]|uniref:HAMP domain-containing sensor histidine kinase n=1 Tax=Halocella sp. SP3-1 TaxID=2382161 RepID=UPI000F75F32F|nr:ATP-binding protein [Halocella sp. SP3-1]AZO96417.1 PAS domain-containing protein [Halocella sp. SP3-1]